MKLGNKFYNFYKYVLKNKFKPHCFPLEYNSDRFIVCFYRGSDQSHLAIIL